MASHSSGKVLRAPEPRSSGADRKRHPSKPFQWLTPRHWRLVPPDKLRDPPSRLLLILRTERICCKCQEQRKRDWIVAAEATQASKLISLITIKIPVTVPSSMNTPASWKTRIPLIPFENRLDIVKVSIEVLSNGFSFCAPRPLKNEASEQSSAWTWASCVAVFFLQQSSTSST